MMTGSETHYSRTFTVAGPRDLEAVLDREAAAAITVAGRAGTGIVVTRHDAQTFTVELSPDVPPGTIRERDLLS